VNEGTKILKVELYYDNSMDEGFKTIIENKLKAIDLKGLTNAVNGEIVGEDSKLENKEIEENFIKYIRHLLEKASDGIGHIIIKFQDKLTMGIYLS
jgi:hypothetical protein